MLTITDPATVPAPPGGYYSHAARVDVGTGALVFVSGQVSRRFRPEALVEVDVVAAVAG